MVSLLTDTTTGPSVVTFFDSFELAEDFALLPKLKTARLFWILDAALPLLPKKDMEKQKELL